MRSAGTSASAPTRSFRHGASRRSAARSSIPRSDPLRVALVGLGWWGRIIAGLLHGNAKLSLVRGVDVSTAAGQFASQLGIAFSNDFRAAIDDPGVQAVILCTPHSQHREQIVRAANAGKHVFCEKPLSLSRADALEAVFKSARSGNIEPVEN